MPPPSPVHAQPPTLRPAPPLPAAAPSLRPAPPLPPQPPLSALLRRSRRSFVSTTAGSRLQLCFPIKNVCRGAAAERLADSARKMKSERAAGKCLRAGDKTVVALGYLQSYDRCASMHVRPHVAQICEPECASMYMYK